MKYIIIYEDNIRTRVFKANSKKEINNWLKTTINSIKESGGEVTFKFPEVIWGHLLNESPWKISIYNSDEINSLKRIEF